MPRRKKKLSKKEQASSRFTEPLLAGTASMTPIERAKFKETHTAHRAALRGDFEPGRKLGLFPAK